MSYSCIWQILSQKLSNRFGVLLFSIDCWGFYWSYDKCLSIRQLQCFTVRGCLLIFAREWMYWGDEIAYPLAKFSWTKFFHLPQSEKKMYLKTFSKCFFWAQSLVILRIELATAAVFAENEKVQEGFQLVRPGCGWGVLSSSFMLLYVAALIKRHLFIYFRYFLIWLNMISEPLSFLLLLLDPQHNNMNRRA